MFIFLCFNDCSFLYLPFCCIFLLLMVGKSFSCRVFKNRCWIIWSKFPKPLKIVLFLDENISLFTNFLKISLAFGAQLKLEMQLPTQTIVYSTCFVIFTLQLNFTSIFIDEKDVSFWEKEQKVPVEFGFIFKMKFIWKLLYSKIRRKFENFFNFVLCFWII